MSQEIERKFLVNKEAWVGLNKPKGSAIKQGYIITDPSKTIRIRITDMKAFLTIKGETKGIVRAEFEYKIPVNDANELLRQFKGNIIKKVRYKIKYKGKTWEIDVFKGKNEGLIMAEIELESENEKFNLPNWVDKEVSGDERYYNSYLSVHPFKTWQLS